jgi:predicted Zn-dependent protease
MDLDDLSNSVVDLIQSGELDAAEAVCRRLQMQHPDQVDGIWRLAMVCEAQDDRAAAAKYYREAAAFMQTNEGYDEEGIADMIKSAERMERGI